MRMHQFTIIPADDVRMPRTYVFSEQGKALSLVTVHEVLHFRTVVDTCCTREIIREQLIKEMLADIRRDIRNRDKWYAVVGLIPGYLNDVYEALDDALAQHAEGALK